MLNCTSNKDGWREVVLKLDVAELKYMFFIPHAQLLHSSNLTSVHAKVQLRLLRIRRFFVFLLFKIVILCTYYFSQSQSSSVADKLAHNCGDSSVGIPVGVGSQGMLLARCLLNNVDTFLKRTISNPSSSEGSGSSRLELCTCESVLRNLAFWGSRVR